MKKDNLRPETLEDYIGQESIKDLLTTSIVAALGRNQPIDHILLNGPPGLGKTTLALIIGNQMGWKVRSVIGPSLGNSTDVEKLFMVGWKPKTILFIDEIHRMRKPAQEVFYPILEDNELQFRNGGYVIPPLTVIGATTNVGRLERPFIDRFGLQLQLDYYKTDELEEILHNSAEKLRVNPDFDAFTAMSYRSRGTPRIANNILKRIRDYSEVHAHPVDREFASRIMTDKLHIDGKGLQLIDRRYLRALCNQPGMGVDAIATKLNEEVETIEDYVEPYLLRIGFIERRRNGRWVTSDGEEHIRSIPRTMDR
jgi:Holliday junction DNA helicase RuvB